MQNNYSPTHQNVQIRINRLTAHAKAVKKEEKLLIRFYSTG